MLKDTRGTHNMNVLSAYYAIATHKDLGSEVATYNELAPPIVW